MAIRLDSRCWLATCVVAWITFLGAVPCPCSGVDRMPWQHDLAMASQEAKAAGKLLLVHFYAEWCGPCRRLENNVYSLEEVGAALAEDFVLVKVNIDEKPDLPRFYKVDRWPTDMVLTPDGTVLAKQGCEQDPASYVARFNKLAMAYAPRRKQGASEQRVLPLANRHAPSYEPNMNSHALPTQSAASNEGLSQPVQSAPVAEASLSSNVPADVHTLPAVETTVNAADSFQPSPHNVNSVGDSAWQAGPPNAPSSPGLASQTVQDLGASSGETYTSGEEQLFELPPGSPPLAMQGYDVVHLLSRDRLWELGDVQFGVIHQGKTYLFASAENQRYFFKNAARLAPIAGGCDAVLAVDFEKQAEGKPEFAAIYGGRLYMFSSQRSLDRFNEAPGNYSEPAVIAARELSNKKLMR